jgi:hypothetical protein
MSAARNRSCARQTSEVISRNPLQSGKHCFSQLSISRSRRCIINPMNARQLHPRFRQWRFGDDWPGRRCGAKTRSGTPCRKPALRSKHRCQLHGGKSNGAPTGANNGNWRHGRSTNAAKESARRSRESARRSRVRLVLLKMMYPLAIKVDAGRASDAEKDALRRLEMIYEQNLSTVEPRS